MIIFLFSFFLSLNIYKKFLLMIIIMLSFSIKMFFFLNSKFIFYLFTMASLGGLMILYSFIIFLSPQTEENWYVTFPSDSFKMFALIMLSYVSFFFSKDFLLKEFKMFLFSFFQDFDCLWIFSLMFLILILSMHLMDNFPGPLAKFF